MHQPLLIGSLSLLLLGGCTVVEPTSDPDPQPPSNLPAGKLFQECGEAAGIFYDPSYELTGGRGAAVADVNDDGWPDLYLAGSRPEIGAPSKLLLNQGDGTFLDATAEWGLDHSTIESFKLASALFADIDNDGDADLLQASIGLDRVYLNEGGEFVAAGSDTLLHDWDTWATALSLADFNGDALLDVYVSEHIYRHSDPLAQPPPPDRLLVGTGGGNFIDRTEWLEATETGSALGAVWSDFDEDGDMDLYTINDHGGFWLPNQLFLNEGASDTGWDFTNASEGSGADLGISGMGAAVGDINNDLHTDLYITNLSEAGGEFLLLGQGDGSFVDVSLSSGAQVADPKERQSSWGADFIDFDNDGWLDLFVAFGGSPEGVDLPYAQPSRNVALRNHEGVFV
ncbi:MAG: VCBS repeat-containing protein, partial [Alphaproteobacteria bacterium]|nr:VCBS repeat-containing protein [Alphaproteobacteria bacterium]